MLLKNLFLLIFPVFARISLSQSKMRRQLFKNRLMSSIQNLQEFNGNKDAQVHRRSYNRPSRTTSSPPTTPPLSAIWY